MSLIDAKKQEDVSEITDAKIYEVSLVDEAANERDFLLLKNLKNGGLKMEDIIKEVLNTELENKKEVEDILKEIDISKEGKYALKNMMKIIQTYADVLPKNMLSMLARLLTETGSYDMEKLFEGIKDELDIDLEKQEEEIMPEDATQALKTAWDLLEEYADELPEELLNAMIRAIEENENIDIEAEEHMNEEENGGEIMGNIEKNLDNLPDSVKPLIENLYKEHQETAEKAKKLEKQLEKEKEEKLEREFIQKAKNDFDRLPVKHEEFGKLLKSVNSKVDEEEFNQLEKLLKSVNEQIDEGKMFKEIGSEQEDDTSSAWGRIEKAAKEIVNENPDLSKPEAVSQVITENPKLYQKYMNEKEG